MYKCWNCGAKFETPVYETLSKEDYFGVGSMFPRGSHHYFTLETCPNCNSDDIEEYDDEADIEEYEEDEDEYDE